MALTIDVINMNGEKVSTLDLSEQVFGIKPDRTLVHEVVVAYLANQRRGTASTKMRAEVSGGGKKPWKQKHTGRARAGSSRSPLWRHGGVTFGPKPRDYYVTIPQSKRNLSLKMVLSDGLKEGLITVMDAISVAEPKTKLVAGLLKKLKLSAVTMVMDQIDPVFKKAGGNINSLALRRSCDLNTYDVLHAKHIVMTAKAVDQLTQRLGAAAGN